MSWASFRTLLPPSVALAEHRGPIDTDLFPPLYADEVQAAERMTPPRRAEFVAGRALAREAMRSLGASPAAIPRRADRSAAWPPELRGSITHCDGLVAAAVADARACRALGIDAEVLSRIRPDILSHIGTPAEQLLIEGLDAASAQLHVAVTFAAKECVQKGWGALLECILPFEAVEAEHPFNAKGPALLRVRDPRLVAAIGSEQLQLRWTTHGDLVLVAIALERN